MNSLAKQMYDGLKPLYKDLMDHCGAFCDEYTEQTGVAVVSFAAQWGKFFPQKERDGILFVGRATRGADNDDRDVDKLFDDPDERIFNRLDQMIRFRDYCEEWLIISMERME